MASAYAGLLSCAVLVAGCATGDGKFVEPRGKLDQSIFYVERDKDNRDHPLSGPDASRKTATRVPQRAVVDVNSTIEIRIDKEKLGAGTGAAPVSEPSGLLQNKQRITKALGLIDEVVKARLELIAAYKQRDLKDFQKAASARARLEIELIDRLKALWPESDSNYSRLVDAYDPPSFTKLQAFLGREIETIDAANRAYEEQLKKRQRTLSVEAFLSSQAKEETATAAIHVEGYDSIKAQSLNTRDRLGLDLSPQEYERLQAQMQATQDFAAALERLRRGEATLNETVRQVRSQMAPEIGKLLEEAERLAADLSKQKLTARRAETQKLVEAYLDVLKTTAGKTHDDSSKALRTQLNALLEELKADDFVAAATNWVQTAKTLRTQWEAAAVKPDDVLKLIQQTNQAIGKFNSFRESLPARADDIEKRITAFFDTTLAELEKQSHDLAASGEAVRLRDDLRGYARDFRRVASFVQQVLALRAAEVNPVAEIPASTSAAFNVPLEDIKNTLVDLEATPRVVGDVVTVKATLKDASKKELETSVATFRMGRYGYYADLSPAVVLIKPNELAGGDDGFRFAPTLSWMHHWPPRPEETGTWASIRRSLDPAIGLHTAFTNFTSSTSNDSVQIGIGLTLSFWKNRLQFGYGYNLMARTHEEGRRYFFVGSDLIGLLQAAGIAKQ